MLRFLWDWIQILGLSVIGGLVSAYVVVKADRSLGYKSITGIKKQCIVKTDGKNILEFATFMASIDENEKAELRKKVLLQECHTLQETLTEICDVMKDYTLNGVSDPSYCKKLKDALTEVRAD